MWRFVSDSRPHVDQFHSLTVADALTTESKRHGNYPVGIAYRNPRIVTDAENKWNGPTMKTLLGSCPRCPRCSAPLELMESSMGCYLTCPNYPFCQRNVVELQKPPEPDCEYSHAA